MKFNAWVSCPRPEPDATFRMFCLPFAGGGASLYRSWGEELGADIEVCPIQLPGRESRVGEPAHHDFSVLASALANQLSLYLDRPYFIYGHSMGALLAFEAIRALQESGQALPQIAFLGAHRAAHLKPRRQSMLELDDAEFIARISAFGGFQKEVLESEELLNFILPTLRADFSICDGYEYAGGDPIDCPIVAISGAHDPEVPPEDMGAWQEHTRHPVQHITLDAGHFFIKTHSESLISVIRRFARQVMV
ncbi:MAG: thioesterase II family protein [Congregibacter sp.]